MSIEITEEIRSNFHLFWDNFPAPVMLVHKDRTILARNKLAESVGYTLGTRCSDMGNKEDHKGCQANLALSEGTAKRAVGYYEPMNMVLDSYWVPLAGMDDIFLHFSIDITPYAAGRLFPKKCDSTSGCGCGGE